MKKAILFFLAVFHLAMPMANGQIRLPAYEKRINPELLDPWAEKPGHNDGRWSAYWIGSPDADRSYGVYLFRKLIELPQAPREFLVHVSADNRYKLYVNGVQVAAGPAKGDTNNWNFDSVDLAPWLHAGTNAICAQVWNFAEWRPVAIISLGDAGFLLQGNTEAERIADTGPSWKVLRTQAYTPIDGKPFVRGYYACGCLDRLDCSLYPWGWLDPGFDDSAWAEAKHMGRAAIKFAGDYYRWHLVPRAIPPMEVRPIEAQWPERLEIPAGQTFELLLDNKALTTGYPRLYFSGGRGAEITLAYAEALFEKGGHKNAKGNRDETEGKVFEGYPDIIIADGGAGRSFEPMWWRTWRYLKLSVKTAGEPLTIDSLRAVSSMYPFERVSRFDAPEDPSLQRMLDIGWRTARLCAHETYMDCPYYEQLQYFGDSRIQALVTMFNTRDTCLVRNLLEQGRQSLCSDGITQSRYPSNLNQYIAPYSLFWLNSCHDWWMYRGDEAYLRTLLPVMRSVLGWFAENLDGDGLLRRVPTWDFGDWAEGMRYGMFKTDSEGRSSYLDMIHVIALKDAAEMEEAFGDKRLAEQYRDRAETASHAMQMTYWSPERDLYADNGDLKEFSEHMNALAILAGLVDGAQASDLLKRTLAAGDIRRCTIYFRYYLQRAMAESGNADLLIPGLDILRDQMALGLTTWAEQPEPTRSDCHAWGSSPNIEFFRMVLGIDSAAPGFRKVRIAPAPGKLTKVSGAIPHPLGEVSVALEVVSGLRLSAVVELPGGIDGVFVWKGKENKLRPGRNVLSLPL